MTLVPILISKITLIKIDVDDTYLKTCFSKCAGTLFFEVGDLENIKEALWE